MTQQTSDDDEELRRRLGDLALASNVDPLSLIAAAVLLLLDRSDPGPMYCPPLNHIHGPGPADEPLARPGQTYGVDCWLYSDPARQMGPMIPARQ